MVRRNIYDILNSGNVDLEREYSRFYFLFYESQFWVGYNQQTICGLIKGWFHSFDKRLIKRCISLEDFDDTFDFCFVSEPNNFNLEYLLNFLEYTINFCNQTHPDVGDVFLKTPIKDYLDKAFECIDELGFKAVENDGITIVVEKDSAALSVAETVEPVLSYKILEYNHRRLKGDLMAKKSILKLMADDLEPDQKRLQAINASLKSDLFQLMNKFIRHNNNDNKFIKTLNDKQTEEIYDNIYQMWLLAKMELEQADRNDGIKSLIRDVNA
ncbi:MAG: hypothetical protein J6B49_05410 [Phascolarctobacterium sp.]|nr:hypothetical protein [Phascolarctobacterium sp.]